MTAGLRILAAGPGASIQDGGRRGLARWGVSPAGPVDWARHALALALAGEAPGAPAIEVGPGGIVVQAQGRVALGLAGSGARSSAGAAPMGLTLGDGERLELRPGAGGWATLAAGGLDPGPAVLGSHATALRTGLGPAPPEAGATYACRPAEAAPPNPVTDPVGEGGPIRLLPGPQRHLFGEDVLGGEWTVSTRRDRMGCWLDGPPQRCEAGHDIASDGVVEGAIQVPGSGAPVVLLADRQTTGGYPKPAVVVRADLPRLVQMAPGTTFRFAWTTRAEARAARLALESALRAPKPRARAATAETLATENIVSGVWSP
jgi:biotin-dependent carboxylase-like uncharacterized protein